MRALIKRFSTFYGAHPLHLLGTIAAWALAGYVVIVLGPQALWNPFVWWQSIAVWFLAAIIAHDLVLFPLYALADRSFSGALAAGGGDGKGPHRGGRRVAAELRPRPDPGGRAVVAAVFSRNHRAGTVSLRRGDRAGPTSLSWALAAALVSALYGFSALAYAARLAVTTRGPKPISTSP